MLYYPQAVEEKERRTRLRKLWEQTKSRGKGHPKFPHLWIAREESHAKRACLLKSFLKFPFIKPIKRRAGQVGLTLMTQNPTLLHSI